MAVSVGVGERQSHETEKEYDYNELKCSFCKISIPWIRKRPLGPPLALYTVHNSPKLFYLHSFHFFLITVCPREKPFKMCIYDKCLSSPGCPSHPSAQCQMNYCGECTAEYFDENGRKVDCTNGKIKNSGECSKRITLVFRYSTQKLRNK